MGNFSVYLSKEEKERINRLAEETGIKHGAVMRIIIKNMPHDYLKDLVNNYKDDLNR